MRKVRTNSSFRIIAFSDWRSQSFEYLEAAIQDISEIDLFIYGGDDLNRLLEFETILKRIVDKTKQKKLLFVAGNDDIPAEKNELAEKEWAHDLEKNPFFLGKFAFLGNEGSIDGLGFHQKTERQVSSHLRKQKEQANKYFQQTKFYPIIVSHTPPFGILDSALRHSTNGLARHIGSKALKNFINKQAKSLTICGHVHLWGGRLAELTGGNLVLNISSHDHKGADGNLAIIDLTTSGKIEITSYSLHEWFSGHELSKLSQVSWKRFHQLRAKGIESLNDVHESNFHRLIIKGGGENLAKIWLAQASLFRENSGSRKNSKRNKTPGFAIVFPEKMDFLAKKHFVVWDIETDLTQTHLWIIGAFDTKSGEFKQFFNLRDDRQLLTQFLDWLNLRKTAQLVSYSGSKLESRAVTNSLNKFGIVDTSNLITHDIDLCIRLRYGCATTAKSLQLKELASSLKFKYRHPDISGMYVGLVFSEFLRSGNEPKKLFQILEYNEDDVKSTAYVLKKIMNINNRKY